MGRRMVRLIAVVILGALVLFVAASLYAALEAQLLVGASPSSDNVPYQKTQWYGFTAAAGQGYRINLTPSTGNPDLYLFDTGFNRVGYSKSAGLTQDKVWFGQATSGPMHIAAYGVYNPSSNYTIQVITSPYLKTISPTSGTVGTLVTLTGFGFGTSQGTSYVKFGAVTATSYYSWTNTQIKVYVPSSIASGTIQAVVYVASRASNALNFTAAAASSDGTMFRYDLGRTGSYPNGPTTLPLNIKWTYYPGWSAIAPTIANNVIYLPLGELYALDANTGVLKWTYPAQWGTSTPPAVTGGIVYFCNSATPFTFYAVDANNGSLKWKYSADQSGGTVYSTPAVFNGIVYLCSEHKVYALDANNGSLKWVYNLPTGENNYMSFAISNGVIYFQTIGGIRPDGYPEDKIYAIYANNGSVKWVSAVTRTVPGIEGISSSPTVANGVLYFGGAKLYAFDANTGVLKWKSDNYGGFNTPAISNGVVYVCNANPQSANIDKLYAFDANTGVLKWSSIGSLTPVISNGLVYTVSYDKNFYALDANSGNIKWSYAIGGFGIGDWTFRRDSAVVYNGKVYIGGASGYLYCFGP